LLTFFLICIVRIGIKVHSTLRPPNGLLLTLNSQLQTKTYHKNTLFRICNVFSSTLRMSRESLQKAALITALPVKLTGNRDVAEGASRWLPTVAARVRVRAACGVCGGQSGTGAIFLLVLQFPLPIIIPPISPSS
jgi:hypothetical protein